MHWITCISLRLDVYIHMYHTRQTKKTFVDEDIKFNNVYVVQNKNGEHCK